jgi:hypothetical protein
MTWTRFSARTDFEDQHEPFYFGCCAFQPTCLSSSYSRSQATGAPPPAGACWSWSSGCEQYAAAGTSCSAGRACSTLRCLPASPAWSRSCGWPPTSAAATGACMSGRARGAPRRTHAPCGGCSRWCRCRVRSTTSYCPGCAATSCCAAAGPGRCGGCGGLVAPGRGLMTGPAPYWWPVAGRVGLALALARQGNPSLVLMTVVKAGGPTQGPHPRACQGPWQMSRFN